VEGGDAGGELGGGCWVVGGLFGRQGCLAVSTGFSGIEARAFVRMSLSEVRQPRARRGHLLRGLIAKSTEVQSSGLESVQTGRSWNPSKDLSDSNRSSVAPGYPLLRTFLWEYRTTLLERKIP
jgi:hypothetical protein